MPAALDVNWEAIEMLALEVGVREAARRLGLDENTVKRRCTREGWLAERPANVPLPPTVLKAVPNVPSAAKILQQSMREDAMNGRAKALRLSRRALEGLDRDKSDADLQTQEVATVAASWIKSASIAGGYGAAEAVIKMNLNLTAQSQEGVTLDAEIVQPVDGEELP